MKKLMLIALAVALFAGSAQAYLTMTLSTAGPVAPDSFFDVYVDIDTDMDIAMVQAVLDVSDPNLTLTGVTAPLASLAFINAPDTAVADYFPATHTGVFTAMVIQMYAGPVAGDYPLDLVLVVGSSFSTAVFDAVYNPSWDMVAVGTTVVVGEEIIPEPATIGLLALVGLGSVIAGRKK